MKLPVFSTLCLAALLPTSAFADAKDDAKAAAKKLAEAENYSWTTTTDMGANSQYTPGAVKGKALKSGVAHVTMPRRDDTVETFVKGENSVTKTPDGWKTPAEMRAAAEASGERRGRGFGGMGRGVRTPAAQIEDLVGKVDKLEEKDGALTGTLSPEAVKGLLTFGGRGGRGGPGGGGQGGEGPQVSDESGTITLWIKDGSIAKVATHVKGKVKFGDREMDADRKTTTEISEVGTTKLEVPEEVAKKLDAPPAK